MRIAIILMSIALLTSPVHAAPLTAADREALIERLELLRESADAKVDARFRLAISAYRGAMATNDAAMDLYLKCIEKVNFEDQQRKASEFRDWKRKEADHLSDAGFRLALRYQLHWLVLTLRAASEKTDRDVLAGDASEIVDAVFRDADKLDDQQPTLRQPVTSTVFARAYELGDLNQAEWPLSPVLLDGIYEQVLLPPLRSPAKLESLRATWIKRIQQQGIEVETWVGHGGKNRQGPDQSSVNAAKFATETLPGLQWRMEMDLFRSGDESGAALRMLAHIQRHLGHKSAREWSEEFKTLLAPPAAPTPTAAPPISQGA